MSGKAMLRLLSMPSNTRPRWKGIDTNTLALSSVTKEKSFITLTSGVIVIKLFFFVADKEAK